MLISQILNNRSIIVFIIPFLIGSLSILSFQPFNLTFINFITLPCLFLIITYVNRRSKNTYRKKPYLINIFYTGYFFGYGFFLFGNFWISHSLTFDNDLTYLIPFSIILIPAFLALFFGFSTLLIGRFLKNNFYSILLFCSSLSIFDFLRSKILTGFPWNLWSYSWSWFPEVIQILNPIGLFAFNLLSLTIFLLPLMLIFKKTKQNITIFSILILLFFINYIFGSYKLNKNQFLLQNLNQNNKDLIYVKIVTTNNELNYSPSISDVEKTLENLIRFSDPKKERKTLFIWPEGTFGGYSFADVQQFKRIFSRAFSKNHVIIFGINTKKNNSEKDLYNSLLAVDNNFEVIYNYNKTKLVPFGEFLPYEKILDNLGLTKITRGYGFFSKGKEQDILSLEKFNILPLICYEIIFTELVQMPANKINLIVNISEDGWFGDSIGPHQHLAKAIFRAVESNTFLARSTNKGISAFIDNSGVIIKRLEPNEAGNIELKIPLIETNRKNKNDLIFFLLLITYISIFLIFKKNEK